MSHNPSLRKYPADDARDRARAAAKDGSLLAIRPNVSQDELWDACRVLQDEGWAGLTTMGDAIRALARGSKRNAT